MALATSSPNARPAPFLSSQSPLCKPAPPFGHTTGNSNSVGFASLGSQPSSALGFGFASSAPMPSASFGGPVSGPSLPTLTTHQRQQPRKPSSNRRRRREDSSDEEAELEDLRPIRPVKKMRAPSTSVREPTAASMPQNAAPADEILRQLGNMSKSDILAVFDQLIHQQPALASSIQPLLPRPSPSTFLLQLPILENNVLSCIPQQSRPEYVLSRVKTVLDNYVAEFRLALQSFNVASEHVSSAFTFLQSLTASLQRLQRALPPSNPSLATLVPNLFNAWHLFLSKVSSSVNVHGKILGADFVQRMFDDIQSLCDALPHQNHNPSDTSPTECHRFMHGVAERLNKEIGWLASRRSRDSTVEMEEL